MHSRYHHHSNNKLSMTVGGNQTSTSNLAGNGNSGSLANHRQRQAQYSAQLAAADKFIGTSGAGATHSIWQNSMSSKVNQQDNSSPSDRHGGLSKEHLQMLRSSREQPNEYQKPAYTSQEDSLQTQQQQQPAKHLVCQKCGQLGHLTYQCLNTFCENKELMQSVPISMEQDQDDIQKKIDEQDKIIKKLKKTIDKKKSKKKDKHKKHKRDRD